MTFKHKLSRRLARLWPVPAILVVLLGPGCELQRNVAGLSGSEVSTVVLSPSSVTVRTDESTDFAAVGLTSSGDTADFTISWAATGGAVTDMGKAGGRHLGRYKAGKACGSFKVIARAQSGSASDTSTTTVECPVASVAITPSAPSVLLGNTVQLSATTKDQSGHTLTGRSVAWSSGAPGVAAVSQSGLVTAVAGGSATITATSEGVDGTATVTVSSVPVASVTVTPASATIPQNQTVQLSATARDIDGNPLPGRTATWTTSNAGVATVSSGGLVTGKTPGSVTITATSEGKQGTAAITVTLAPVASVTVTPSSAMLQVNKTLQLTATPKDANGNALTGRAVTWQTSNASLATVSATGLVTGVAVGSVTITATSEGHGGTAAVTITAPPPPGTDLPAFPGAEGFGSTTPGGRGGTVYRVTTLNESGPGSLREAVAASGARVIIFEISGTIELTSNIIVKNPYVTIAGQTAPSPGITLRNAALQINSHDVVVQHLRIRVGDGPVGPSLSKRDGLDVYGQNIIVDHVSVSWAIDENASTTTAGNRHDITISNAIISEGLENTGAGYSKGYLIGQTAQNIALIRSLLAHNKDRNPYAKGDTRTLVVNNVIYNWGGSKAFSIDDWNGNGPNFTTAIGNVYIPGADTRSGAPIHLYDMVPTTAKLYVADNSMNRAPPPADPWSLVRNDVGAAIVATAPPTWTDPMTLLPNAQVEAYVLANAGSRPADRDAVDIRIVNDVKNGTGRIIDSPSQVGGWPAQAVNTRPLTLPPNPNADDDGDGYTNLEEWLFQFSAQVEGR